MITDEERRLIETPDVTYEGKARIVADLMYARFKDSGLITTMMYDYGIDLIAAAIAYEVDEQSEKDQRLF